MAIIHVTKENFASEVLASKEPVLVDFGPPGACPAK